MAGTRIHHSIRTILLIITGTGLLAFAVKCVYDPSGLVVGGFSGIAILVKEVSSYWMKEGIPLGLTTFLLNLPVFAAAWPMKGKEFVTRTFLATILLSSWLLVIPDIHVAETDLVLAAVFGGVSAGAGIGLVLSTGTTTGGTDMLGSLLQRMFPSYTIAQIMAVLDAIIIIAGGFLFGFSSALYAVVSVYVTTKISDALVVGTRYARSAYIITKKPEDVAKEIFRRLERGVTGIYAQGMYTGQDRKILFCVVSKKQIVRLKSCVYEQDPDAFVIVTEAKEVLGEGFRHNEQRRIG